MWLNRRHRVSSKLSKQHPIQDVLARYAVGCPHFGRTQKIMHSYCSYVQQPHGGKKRPDAQIYVYKMCSKMWASLYFWNGCRERSN